jgi:hypothetical protein
MYGPKPNLKYNVFPCIWHHVPILVTSHSLKYDIIFTSLWCHIPIHVTTFHVPICHNIHSTIVDIHTPTPLPNHAPSHLCLNLHLALPPMPHQHLAMWVWHQFHLIVCHMVPHGATSSICHIDATLVPYPVMPSDKLKAMSSCATMNLHTPTLQLSDLVQNELASNFGHEQCTFRN